MMEARWAKDYYDGTYNKRQAEIDQALRDGKVPSNGGYNNEGGVSYIVSAPTLLAPAITD